MKRVVIGEQPAKGYSHQYPLYPYNRLAAASRLIELCEISEVVFERDIAKFNLCPFDSTEEEFWNFGAHRLAQSMKMGRILDERRVLLLGKRVKVAFGIADDRKCGKALIQGFPIQFYFIPHPSGLNRFYNDPKNVADAKAILKEWLYG